jgi:hypothetical protein
MCAYDGHRSFQVVELGAFGHKCIVKTRRFALRASALGIFVDGLWYCVGMMPQPGVTNMQCRRLAVTRRHAASRVEDFRYTDCWVQ